jgi:natural product biosynthesis luciferase-like monooxygenase protein
MTAFSAVLIGHEPLTQNCGQVLLDTGHTLAAVVTRCPTITAWAKDAGLRVEAPGPDLAQRLAGLPFDWLLSIANLDMLPADLLDLPSQGAVNFHDGPLPRYAGLNAPVWAKLAGEAQHGITWHLIAGGVDEGDILLQRMFDIADDDTALSLNSRCFAEAIDSFPELVDMLATGAPAHLMQDLEQRSYFGLFDRPSAAGRLDFAQDADTLVRLVRGLDHGHHGNPLSLPKIMTPTGLLAVHGAEAIKGGAGAQTGTVLQADADSLVVVTATGPLKIWGFTDLDGQNALHGMQAGQVLPILTTTETEALDAALDPRFRMEGFWRRRLETLEPVALDLAQDTGATGEITHDLTIPSDLGGEGIMAAMAILMARLSDRDHVDLAWQSGTATYPAHAPYLAEWAPLRITRAMSLSDAAQSFGTDLARARTSGGFVADLPARIPNAAPLPMPAVGLVEGALTRIDGTVLTLAIMGDRAQLIADASRLSPVALDLIAARLAVVAAALAHDDSVDTPVADLPVMPDAELALVTQGWNNTAVELPDTACLHHMIEAQAARTPDATALVFEGQSLSYGDLDKAANRTAHVLQSLGVGQGTLVGLNCARSPDMVIAALGILKAGGAYVPLDPAFPPDRIALYIEDSACPVIITQAQLAPDLPQHSAQILVIDTDSRIQNAPDTQPSCAATAADMAYMIYTSGSTGKPKGVMVEHRNVVNFCIGMDARIPHKQGDTWLAVTSLSFDISVLELFWTLARGFKLVLSSDETRALVSNGPVNVTGKGMEFSLYYWGNDDGVGRDKYKLLLEGAKFADQHGFCAVWTPERHFHAFGGPYPNPSVTGAAVAAVTQNISVRAGSCVAPLHHPARIAEEWAVIDNLTNGRAGLAIASGWQPDDFVLRPENAPPNNKPAMMQAIEDLRKLWAGETVEYPTAAGGMHGVITQPRPVSKTLPIWVTTAGNPDTWREAGTIGANVLTHLLGQSIDEVGGKIKLYHQALREAGHNPDDFKVTLMLHSYLGQDRDAVREIAREPMKDYLRSAAGLIKQYAWAFPAFKRPQGVNNAFQLDLGSLEEDELEAILDFAFLRYFDDSGLFGTIDDAMERVEQVRRIGVTEVACLIDYGIPVAQVLEGLVPLAEVVKRANSALEPDAGDYSIAAQIVRHNVSHLQCTPSMARMIAMNDEARGALSKVKHLMLGGEALPGALVAEFASMTQASVENMYGPTETTIWSTTQSATPEQGVINIGTPIANTQVYVLDDAMQPVPVGMAGELYIGGHGVTRGYWQREDLTAERFLPDPFVAPDRAAPWGARMYRTGDLVRWRSDGRLDFLGRADHQIKLRGYRIELGEIEAAMDAFTGIRQAVVMAREDVPGLVRLVGYYTCNAALDDAALKAHLAAMMPDYMVPSAFVMLDAFPLTPNRKVDRKALPAPQVRTVAATPVPVEPAISAPAPRAEEPSAMTPAHAATSTPPDNTYTQATAEAAIAAIWSRILGVQGIGARDNFFDLGGHSLLAVQAHREIRADLGIRSLSITDIFRFPVLSALAVKLVGQPLPEGGASVAAPAPTAPAPAPVTPKVAAPPPPPAPQPATQLQHPSEDRATFRSEAMSRRRQLRAERLPRTG